MDKLLQVTLADAINFLTSNQLAYALIGGLASSIRGEPRVTADVDLVIGTEVDGALQLIEKLDGSSFSPLFDGVEEVVEQAFILPLRHRQTSVKVDLSIGLSGFEKRMMERSTAIELEGQKVQVVTAEDLLLMKMLAGRPQDQQDVKGIVTVQGDSLDWKYCRDAASQLSEAVDVNLVLLVERLYDDHQQGRG